jgi:hypothetical protein
MKVTGWQPHSVRGFLSGTVGKEMGLAVSSTKGEDGERSYSVKGLFPTRCAQCRRRGSNLGGFSLFAQPARPIRRVLQKVG